MTTTCVPPPSCDATSVMSPVGEPLEKACEYSMPPRHTCALIKRGTTRSGIGGNGDLKAYSMSGLKMCDLKTYRLCVLSPPCLGDRVTHLDFECL